MNSRNIYCIPIVNQGLFEVMVTKLQDRIPNFKGNNDSNTCRFLIRDYHRLGLYWTFSGPEIVEL